MDDRMQHAADQQFFSRLASANDSFASGLPSTLARLGQLGGELDPAAPNAAAAELQAMLHTVAGSAVTFGYRGLGQHARALEQRLRVLMTFDAVAHADWSIWLGELGEFVEAGRRDPRALG
ncbi:Hpt domain-containing protein [Massilia sp. G4R7]|uniref:Hpt domain-containing protein n=1 Tax=Massilia phyllostachyos TaxID=2898585 RepID=A0ABS8Q688_9BURK|nr:Hpt domain-containing protein [Massilia phyllostachyos]MCD2516592.1 Hpt domain-containing protein [Massilia phyllostachyos]